MKINSHILRINGAVEIPKELSSLHNYKVTVEGAVPKMETSNNEDGTYNVTYKMKPIKVELITETGETIKAKDSRSNSTLNRSQARAIWLDKKPNCEEEKFYDLMMGRYRAMANDIADIIIKEKNL
jgi:hypothetical protein